MYPIKKYKCSSCSETHEDHNSAEHCCLPDVDVVYVCDECDREWEYHSEAEDCCKEDEESDEDECQCTHERAEHSDNGDCQVFINKFIGDCPCATFELI